MSLEPQPCPWPDRKPAPPPPPPLLKSTAHGCDITLSIPMSKEDKDKLFAMIEKDETVTITITIHQPGKEPPKRTI